MENTTPAERQVTLSTSDKENVQVPVTHAQCFITIRNMLEDLGVDDDAPIPLPNVARRELDRALEYVVQHIDDPPKTEEQVDEWRAAEITGWDATFVARPFDELFHLILAANFLDCKPLMDLICKHVAHQLRGKPKEDIKVLFGLPADTKFTQEEEDAIRRDNEWLGAKPSGLPIITKDEVAAEEPAAKKLALEDAS